MCLFMLCLLNILYAVIFFWLDFSSSSFVSLKLKIRLHKSYAKFIFKNQYYSMSQVKGNNTVKVNYTGKLSDGQIFDTSEGKEPIEFTLGQGRLIPGLEKGLIDMKLHEKKTISIVKEEAYGEVNESLIQEVNKKDLPQDMEPEVGMGLVSKSPEGQEINLMVVEVKEESIIIDGNHPLAGKDLIFEIEVLEIKEAVITE
jgi:FKBP-type peptidyl-prolyl cis-trans isomerase 2